MDVLFLKLLNMSIAASWMILAVLVFRFVLKNAPKYVHCILWGLVAIRLICPVSFESGLSLVPNAQTVTKETITEEEKVAYSVSTGISAVDDRVNITFDNGYLGESTNKKPIEDIDEENINIIKQSNNSINIMDVVSYVWCAGVVIMFAYSIIVYIRIYLKISASIRLQNNIYICDNIASPFILGIIKPRVYLPSSLSEKEIKCVVAHENAHIARLDYVWKPLGFMILSIYWFNPIIWIAYILLCRDIELACDERVIKYMNMDDKKEYSRTLLSCSVSHRLIAACPVAFGEVAVGRRVKTVLNYKKPAFWMMSLAVVVCMVVAVCFLTNPKTYADNIKKENIVKDDTDNNEINVVKKEDGNVVDNDNTSFSVETGNIFNSEAEELVFVYEHIERNCIYRLYLNTIDKSFKMKYGLESFSTASGTYVIDNNKIVMQDLDEPEKYVFEIVDGQLMFIADESTEMPLYAHELDEKLDYIWLGRKSDGSYDEVAFETYSNDANYEIVRLINDGCVFRDDVLTGEENELQLQFFREYFKDLIVNWD